MIGRPISLLYADQPQIIGDAQRCHRERTRVVRETSVRRHERVDGVRQTLVFASLDAERIVIYAQETSDVANAGIYIQPLKSYSCPATRAVPSAICRPKAFCRSRMTATR